MRRPLSRAATIIAVGLLIFGLSFFFEPRKTTLSCKSVSSCLGISTRHRYLHSFPEGEVLTSETTLKDGSLRYEKQIAEKEPTLLFLALTKDAASWSKDFRSQQRNVYDFLDLLVSTELDLGTASLALLTSSKEEYAKLVSAVENFPFAKVTVLFKPDDPAQSFPYDQRHDPKVQLQRRAAIAGLRNYLMLRALDDEEHIVWVDADVVAFSPDIVQAMIAHSQSNPDAGLMTARCYQHLMDNYDKNAWKVNSPDLVGPVEDSSREAAVYKLVSERLEIPALLNESKDDALVPLDSVGGTILYIRSSLVRQGLVFPTFNVVGTEWGQAGWIGVETEGICYMARSIKGGGCFVLGGSHHVRHSDLG